MKPAILPPTRPSRVRFGVLAFLCTLAVLTYLDRICIMRAKKDMQRDLLLSELQMGFVFSAFLWGYTLFEVPGGAMGDRWGSRRVLTYFVLWWSLFTALTGAVTLFSFDSGKEVRIGALTIHLLFDSFMLIMLVRFLFGCGEAGAFPNLARAVGNWFPFRERAVAQGAIWMSARLGAAIAPLVLGRLTAAFGWRRAFWVLGVLGLVWSILFFWWFRERPEDKPDCNQAERDLIHAGVGSVQVHDAGAGHEPIPWRALLLSPNTWALCLAAFCVSFGWYFYPTYQPQFLEDVHGFEYKDSEILTGLPFLCGAAGCILGGRLSDRLVRTLGPRWGRSLIGVFGFSGAGLCFLVAGLVPYAWLAVTLLSLACFINDFAIPVIWAASADIGRRYAGTVSGFMNMLGGFGGMITPILIPVLLGSLGGDLTARWKGVFVVLSTVWFLGATAWLFIDASTPLVEEDPDEEAGA